uniref:7TM_GPCR_Srx domain-containing protein n=1 Tax=Parastrongyloides trichosuri TaxID=131310 RepID=A0A0N4Z7L4_PARTI
MTLLQQNIEVKIFGYLTASISTVFLFIQSLTLIILCKNIQLLKLHKVYIIITVLGILYLFQQIIHFLSGIFCTTKWKVSESVEIFLGAFLNFTYNQSIIFSLILSINRLLIFFNFFEVIKVIIIGLSIVTISFFTTLNIYYLIIYNTHELRIIYSIENGIWDYQTHTDNFLSLIENRMIIICNVVNIFIFTSIIIKLAYQKMIINAKLKNLETFEYILFFQVFINFLFLFIIELLWEFGPIIFPNSDFILTAVNFTWVLYSGKDCFINLLCLREIRKPILEIFRLTKKKSTNKVIVLKEQKFRYVTGNI